MKRLVLALVIAAVACSKYGDGDEHPLPDRPDGASGTTAADGGDVTPASDGGTSSDDPPDAAAIPRDAGGGSFCETEEAKGAIRCLDFDDRPARPFGFDQFVGPAELSAAVNGNSSLALASSLPAHGIIDSLPQSGKALTLDFDVTLDSVTGSGVIAAFLGAGSGCATFLGLVVSTPDELPGKARLTITNVPEPVGDAPLGAPLHITMRSEPPPAAGKTIDGTVALTVGSTVQTRKWSATMPAACVNFTAAIGGGASLSAGTALATYDNVVLRTE